MLTSISVTIDSLKVVDISGEKIVYVCYTTDIQRPIRLAKKAYNVFLFMYTNEQMHGHTHSFRLYHKEGCGLSVLWEHISLAYIHQ